jgi:hypothetical protein
MAGAKDFDFLFGEWRVAHRRLRERLVGCTAWETFDGTCSARAILGGLGNVDDNVLNLPAGSYRAATLRTFEPRTARWSIWWFDARTPHALDPPVVGGFADGVGAFTADDTLNGRPIRVRFLWSDMNTPTPRWEQAFSPDGGENWEINWIMRFTRA